MSPAGVRYIGANVINGAAGEGFYDGVSVGSYSSAFVIGPDDSPLIVGNQEAANRHLQSLLQAALIIKRPLTAPEHLELYNYLINLRWPNVNSIGYLGDKKSWKTEWGIFESINPKTSGYLENSEFKINSGTFKISRDNVFEKDTKVIDPLAMSLVSLPIGNTRQTNTQAAYGAWQFICAKADPGEINIQFISDNEGISAGGYKIKIDSGENITLERSGVGVLISATATPVPGQYHKYEVTRSASGEFELFFDGVSQGTATDNIIKESAFMVFGLTASCRVCLSAVDGTNCILKEVL